jgi:hypothetical protein
VPRLAQARSSASAWAGSTRAFARRADGYFQRVGLFGNRHANGERAIGALDGAVMLRNRILLVQHNALSHSARAVEHSEGEGATERPAARSIAPLVIQCRQGRDWPKADTFAAAHLNAT